MSRPIQPRGGTMGSANQWTKVVFAGGFLAIFMFLYSIYDRKKANVKPLFSFADAFSCILIGLLFGLVTTFGCSVGRRFVRLLCTLELQHLLGAQW